MARAGAGPLVRRVQRDDARTEAELSLTAKELRRLFLYDQKTGEFWRKSNGRLTGSDDGQGYVQIWVDGKLYRAHRLAWLYVHGIWAEQIDHRDGDKSNNRIKNLRDANFSKNSANAKRRSDNKSGFKGVFYYKTRGNWKAEICVRGKKKCLGYFPTPEAAHRAYTKAANEGFGEFARVV